MKETFLLAFALFVTLNAASCGVKQNPSAWRVEFEDPALKANLSTIETFLASGTCDLHDVVYSAEISGQTNPPPPPSLPSGNYVLIAYARDAQCVRYASDCQEITLPAPRGTSYTLKLKQLATPETAPGCTPVLTAPDDAGTANVDDSATVVIPEACDPTRCEGKRCVNNACSYYANCREMHNADPNQTTFGTGVYTFDADGSSANVTSPTFSSFCEMAADGGGWTLLMKMDGTKTTFAYSAPIWMNTTLLNPTSLDLSATEAKLPGFDSIAYTALRLGMTDQGTTRWINVNATGNSLYDTFATKGFITTSAGKTLWQSLLVTSYLEPNCNVEGTNNAYVLGISVRIGFVANNENDCNSPDSWIGFGGNFYSNSVCGGTIIANPASVGNVAACYTNTAAQQNIKTFGYVMVR